MNWSKTISKQGKNIGMGLLIEENHINTIKMDEEVDYQVIKYTKVEAPHPLLKAWSTFFSK